MNCLLHNQGLIIILLCLGCQSTKEKPQHTPSDYQPTAKEDYARWNPDNALEEAKSDIVNGTIKIFYHGTIAVYPVGIDNRDYDLIKEYPFMDAGTGCLGYDVKLRKLQSEYATIYNNEIIRWRKETNAQPGDREVREKAAENE